MATTGEVDVLVEERINQMEAVATNSIEGAVIFLDQMVGSMPRTPTYAITADMPLDIQDYPIDANEPVRPEIDIDTTAMPDTEAIVLPDDPSGPATVLPTPLILEDILIPDDISVANIPFPGDITFPVDNLDESTIQEFNYNESEYVSALLDATKARLLSDVLNGGTGLDATVENDIFLRGEERDLITLEEDVARATAEWSQDDFSLPGGALVEIVQKIYDDFANVRFDRSRDISIEQAKLAQVNTHFAISSSIATEGMLLQHADNVAGRALEASKAVVTLGIALFNVQLQRYQTELDAYKTAVLVFVEELRAEGIKVQNYTAQMQGAKVKAEVQGQRIDNYEAEIGAITAIYDNYKTRVQAAGIKANVEAEKLRTFQIQVEAEINRVRGEVAIYESDTNRYSTNIRKSAISAEIKLKQQDQAIRNHEGNLRLAVENARINLDAFAKNAQMIINASLGGARAYTEVAAGAMDANNTIVQLGSSAVLSETATT